MCRQVDSCLPRPPKTQPPAAVMAWSLWDSPIFPRDGACGACRQLTSSDFGVSTGLISQGYWEMLKWYFVNVERGNIADKLQPRNINVSFSNNSNVPIDVIIFKFYSDQLTIDVETGIVTK